jgi:hypothetical protein
LEKRPDKELRIILGSLLRIFDAFEELAPCQRDAMKRKQKKFLLRSAPGITPLPGKRVAFSLKLWSRPRGVAVKC